MFLTNNSRKILYEKMNSKKLQKLAKQFSVRRWLLICPLPLKLIHTCASVSEIIILTPRFLRLHKIKLGNGSCFFFSVYRKTVWHAHRLSDLYKSYCCFHCHQCVMLIGWCSTHARRKRAIGYIYASINSSNATTHTWAVQAQKRWHRLRTFVCVRFAR